MGYLRAEDILPAELIGQIQQYADGVTLYIPRRADDRRRWGTASGARQELLRRDRAIRADHRAGMDTAALAEKYFLSVKSIQRILRAEHK